jgi:oligopeptide transport system permease protein
MARYIIRRLLWLIPVIFAVSAITFALMHAVPGGPWSNERAVSPGIQAKINQKFHLDDPVPVQYVRWVAQMAQGDLGPSFKYADRSVNQIIAEGIGPSLQLGAMAFLLAVALGIPLGIFAALGHNRWPDYLSTGISIIGIATPSFVLAILLAILFGVVLKWFPVQGWKGPETWILPVIALAGYQIAVIARYTRASMLEVTRKDYIRTAQSKGLQAQAVVVRHMVRNALIPVVTILGPILAFLVTGSFIIETFFGIPGIGRYYVQGIAGRDYGLIMAMTVIYALAVAFMNVVVDVLYAFIDPRIRYS